MLRPFRLLPNSSPWLTNVLILAGFYPVASLGLASIRTSVEQLCRMPGRSTSVYSSPIKTGVSVHNQTSIRLVYTLSGRGSASKVATFFVAPSPLPSRS